MNMLNLHLTVVLALLIFSAAASTKFTGQEVQGLPQSENRTFLDGLKEVLHGSAYTERYQKNRFDCMETTEITLEKLAEAGYQPRLMARLVGKGEVGESHVWLVVPDGAGKWVFIETTSRSEDEIFLLGDIIPPGDPQGYDSGILVDHPEDLYSCFRSWGRG